MCDEFWVLAMQEELNQFERNKVWTLVPRPKHHPIIGAKWVNEQGVITRNKARLVAKIKRKTLIIMKPLPPLQG